MCPPYRERIESSIPSFASSVGTDTPNITEAGDSSTTASQGHDRSLRAARRLHLVHGRGCRPTRPVCNGNRDLRQPGRHGFAGGGPSEHRPCRGGNLRGEPPRRNLARSVPCRVPAVSRSCQAHFSLVEARAALVLTRVDRLSQARLTPVIAQDKCHGDVGPCTW